MLSRPSTMTRSTRANAGQTVRLQEERMRGRILVTVALGAFVGLMGCGVKSKTVDVSPNVTRKPTCENAVTVFEGRGDVPSSYYELAWIETEGNSVWTTDNQMLQKMK